MALLSRVCCCCCCASAGNSFLISVSIVCCDSCSMSLLLSSIDLQWDVNSVRLLLFWWWSLSTTAACLLSISSPERSGPKVFHLDCIMQPCSSWLGDGFAAAGCASTAAHEDVTILNPNPWLVFTLFWPHHDESITCCCWPGRSLHMVCRWWWLELSLHCSSRIPTCCNMNPASSWSWSCCCSNILPSILWLTAADDPASWWALKLQPSETVVAVNSHELCHDDPASWWLLMWSSSGENLCSWIIWSSGVVAEGHIWCCRWPSWLLLLLLLGSPVVSKQAARLLAGWWWCEDPKFWFWREHPKKLELELLSSSCRSCWAGIVLQLLLLLLLLETPWACCCCCCCWRLHELPAASWSWPAAYPWEQEQEQE